MCVLSSEFQQQQKVTTLIKAVSLYLRSHVLVFPTCTKRYDQAWNGRTVKGKITCII